MLFFEYRIEYAFYLSRDFSLLANFCCCDYSADCALSIFLTKLTTEFVILFFLQKEHYYLLPVSIFQFRKRINELYGPWNLVKAFGLEDSPWLCANNNGI